MTAPPVSPEVRERCAKAAEFCESATDTCRWMAIPTHRACYALECGCPACAQAIADAVLAVLADARPDDATLKERRYPGRTLALHLADAMSPVADDVRERLTEVVKKHAYCGCDTCTRVAVGAVIAVLADAGLIREETK